MFEMISIIIVYSRSELNDKLLRKQLLTFIIHGSAL